MLAGLAWRTLIFLVVAEYKHLALSLLAIVGWGMVPYLALFWLARRIQNRWVFRGAAFLFLTSDLLLILPGIIARLDGTRDTSPGFSMAGVELVLQPLISIVFLLPAALLAGFVVDRWR